MINAQKELAEAIGDRQVKYIHITMGHECERNRNIINGTLPDVWPLLDFEYDNGYGSQELYGHIWYTDGTWSERYEYNGDERWVHKSCPALPERIKPLMDIDWEGMSEKLADENVRLRELYSGCADRLEDALKNGWCSQPEKTTIEAVVLALRHQQNADETGKKEE